MEHTRTLSAITLAALLAAGCGDRDRSAPQSAEKATIPAGVAVAQRAPAAAPDAVQPAGLQAMVAARKLIRTGQMTLVVDSYVKASDEVKRIAEANGGYLAEAQAQRGAQDRRHGSLTIRVDAGRFDEAVAAIRALGDVRSENVGTQDVTKAYADLETRLRVKRDTADRLREILRTRTAKLAEVLEAERELARVTEEIEQMEGERRFYDQQVAFSTLTVTLQEPAAIVEAGMFTPVSEALRDSLRVLGLSLAGAVYLVVFLTPWLVIAGGIAGLVWKVIRRVRARRKAAATV